MNPRVLVACPTHSIKKYSLPRWIEAVGAFTYHPREALLVDNSPNMMLWWEFRDQTNVVHMHIDGTPHHRIAESMEHIRQYMLRARFDYWLSLECDVIAPPDTIETMLEWQRTEPADWWCMPAPGRNNAEHLFTNNFMCSLFTRDLCEKVSFAEAPDNRTTDGWFMRSFLDRGFVSASKPPRLLDLEHLANPDKASDVVW